MTQKKQRFSTRIIKLFLLLIAMMVSLQIIALYFGASAIVSRLSNELSDQVTERVIQRFATLREMPAGQVRVIGRLLQSDPALQRSLDTSNDRFLDLLKLELQENPYLSSIYLADAEGDFIQAMRSPRLTTRVIRRNSAGASEQLSILDEGYEVIRTENKPIDYDPRTRPWYLSTTADKVSQFSKPYLFSSSQLPGITVTYPVVDEQGEIIQIVAADITLESVSTMLDEIGATPNTRIYLMTRTGLVLASSIQDDHAVSDPKTGKMRLLTVDELSSDLPKQALARYLQENVREFSLQRDGETIRVRIKQGRSDAFALLTLIPESDLHGPVLTLIFRSLLLFLGITLLATLAVFWVSRSVSRPILLLSKEVGHIQNFTLDEYQGVNSRITEIATMNESLMSAVDALKSFEKYVPRELVKNIIQSEGTAEIGGREVELTLMFTDIENFTTLSEKLSPSQLMEQLSEYFDALTGIISSNNGTIDKYIGDAIMAFWGAPKPVEDSALAACRTALACQQRLDELNLKWQNESRPLMPTRIGIHSGKAIVGNVGSRDHINYSAIGDSVNVASRLEGLNKQFGTKILISEATYLQVKSHIECVEIGETRVKGRHQLVKIYQPVSVIAHPDPKTQKPA